MKWVELQMPHFDLDGYWGDMNTTMMVNGLKNVVTKYEYNYQTLKVILYKIIILQQVHL